MATFQVAAPGFVANGVNDYNVGSAQSGESAAAWRVQLTNSGATFSCTVKQKNTGATTYLASPYRKLYLNGAVADGSLVSTAITDTSLIIIPGGGDCQLSFTALTGGTVIVSLEPIYDYGSI